MIVSPLAELSPAARPIPPPMVVAAWATLSQTSPRALDVPVPAAAPVAPRNYGVARASPRKIRSPTIRPDCSIVGASGTGRSS